MHPNTRAAAAAFATGMRAVVCACGRGRACANVRVQPPSRIRARACGRRRAFVRRACPAANAPSRAHVAIVTHSCVRVQLLSCVHMHMCHLCTVVNVERLNVLEYDRTLLHTTLFAQFPNVLKKLFRLKLLILKVIYVTV